MTQQAIDKIKQAYRWNREKQIAALLEADLIMFNYYAAALDRAQTILETMMDKADAAILICEWEAA
jgi:hypothetical protein